MDKLEYSNIPTGFWLMHNIQILPQQTFKESKL